MTSAWIALMWLHSHMVFSVVTDTPAASIQSPVPVMSNIGQVADRDIPDLFHRMTGKPNKVRVDAKGFHPSVVPAFGYTMSTGLAALVSANISIPSVSGKYSTILTSLAYTQKKQTILPFQASWWSDDGRLLLTTDLRFMNYPSTTFGLGSRSLASAGDTINFNYLKLHGTLLARIKGDFYAGAGFYYDRFWNIRETGQPAGTLTSMQKYGFSPTSTSAGPVIRMMYDSRKNPVDPAQGWFINLTARSNLRQTGSDSTWNSITLEARRYLRFPARSRNTLAIWTYNVMTVSGRPPYLMLPSTGWDDFYNTGRGYIQGRYRGRNMNYLEMEYRFRLTRDGLLGAVLFGNLQSFIKDPTHAPRTIIPGAGTGIRIRLNKYSGANLCIDYGWGIDGQRGVSVNLGEVF